MNLEKLADGFGIKVGQTWCDIDGRQECNTGTKVVVGFALRRGQVCAVLENKHSKRKTKVRLDRLEVGYSLVAEQ